VSQNSMLSIEYTPFLPGIYSRMNLSLDSITGIREFSRANKYLTFLGSYIGVRYFFKERDPIDEMNWSERVASWLDTPLNFMSSVCVGGAVGYLGGHYLLGGNRELIVVKDMSNSEKQILLSKYIEPIRHPKFRIDIYMSAISPAEAGYKSILTLCISNFYRILL